MNYRVLNYDTLDSTNDLAIEFGRQGAEEGTVVLSEYQKKGRGRFGRKWVSAKGKGLLFSILLRPELSASFAPILTHIAAKSVADVLIQKFDIEAKLKKPNDVLVSGKKISGILTESTGTGNKIDFVVIGIGVNINHQKKELLPTATSMYMEKSKRVEKDLVLEEILNVFRVAYGKLK